MAVSERTDFFTPDDMATKEEQKNMGTNESVHMEENKDVQVESTYAENDKAAGTREGAQSITENSVSLFCGNINLIFLGIYNPRKSHGQSFFEKIKNFRKRH